MPPSVVADPPTPTIIARVPDCFRSSSSPTPSVDAAIGSLPSAPPARSSPLARALSITAIHREAPLALDRSPNGPVTFDVRLAPPNTSSVPSPPSASGISTQSWPSSQQAALMAARLGGRGGAAELVGGGNDAHGARLGLPAVRNSRPPR